MPLSIRFQADHITRDPLPYLTEAGFQVQTTGGFETGAVVVDTKEIIKRSFDNLRSLTYGWFLWVTDSPRTRSSTHSPR
jgi:hypothetical protein